MTETLSFDQLLPEGFALKPFQTVGVAYATYARRTFIADEMGLGKTIQALVSLEANKAFPAVVVCPASLKGNWEAEIKRFLPNRSVFVASGSKVEGEILRQATEVDIVVVNYDIVKHWAPVLAQPNGLVLDESHYAKTPTAQRTKAVRELAASVPEAGVVLALTGTPIQNRPVELIAQLQILGTLDKVAPKPRKATGDNGEYTDKDWEFAFKFAYCGPEHNGHGWEFKGSSNLGQLNDRLRSTCLVRRERAEVLDLSDTQRVSVPLSLNGHLKAYKAAEADILSFCKAKAETEARIAALKVGDDADKAAQLAKFQAEQKVRRAEILVTLTTLRRLAGEAKVEATVEWVENFLDSNPEKSLVIFAWHQEVQTKLVQALAAYNPAQILGGQKDVQAQKERFQNGDTRVIVCSIKAASEGHTLTAASDVLFVEQPWHAGAEQQAEDRCNRIGRTAENVFAWKLLAAGTVDEWVAGIIEKKRSTFKKAVIGGEDDTTDESSVTEALLEFFQRKAEEES